MNKAKLGSGARFKAVEKAAAKSGARNPAAVAGIKKYDQKTMTVKQLQEVVKGLSEEIDE